MKKNNINKIALVGFLGIGMCLHAGPPPGSSKPQHNKVGSSVNQGRALVATPNPNRGRALPATPNPNIGRALPAIPQASLDDAPELPPRTYKSTGITSPRASKPAGGIKLPGADNIAEIILKKEGFKSGDKLTTQVGVAPIETGIKRGNTKADYLSILSGSFESNKEKILNVLSSKNINKEKLGDVLISVRGKSFFNTSDDLSEFTTQRVDAYLHARSKAIGDLPLGQRVPSAKREQFQQELSRIFTTSGSRETGDSRAKALADVTIALHQDAKLGNILQ